MTEQQQGDEPWAGDQIVAYSFGPMMPGEEIGQRLVRVITQGVGAYAASTPELASKVRDAIIQEAVEYGAIIARRRDVVDEGAKDPLTEWWLALAEREVEPMAAKMHEYGGGGRAIDLIDIGKALRDSKMQVPRYERDGFNREPNDAEYSELGIYFYLVGKFGRWKAAVAEGRPVSDDTLHDIGIYVRMVQRIRQAGGWPE